MATRSEHAQAIRAALNAAIADNYTIEFTVTQGTRYEGVSAVSLDLVEPDGTAFEAIVEEDWRGLPIG